MTASAMRALLDHAEEMQRIAATFERPDGVMELIEREYALLPEVLEALVGAWVAIHVRATDSVTGDPLPAPVMELLEQIARTQRAAAQAAAEVAPLARRLSQARIDALRDPRNRMWDHRANPGHAA